ncbi:MAG: Nramp family divalent metal transporter [Vicinamibacteria bacterium]
MNLSKSAFPPAPEALRSRNPLRHLKFYGPGAIIASVTIGSGETVFASRGGAIFGYSLLWCFLLGAVLKAVQVYSSMRIMTLTGNHPVAYWERMRGPRAWFPLLMLVVSLSIVPSVFSALPKFLASLLASLYEVSFLRYEQNVDLLASVILLGCALLALGISYRILEWSQTAISLLFLTFIVAAFVAFRPDVAEMLRGAFVVSIPHYPPWLRENYPAIAARPPWVEVMTYVGIVGGNSTDYIAYLSFLREKGWGLAGGKPSETAYASSEDAAEAKLWLRAPRLDAVLSFGLVALFSVVFLVLGTVILSPARLIPDGAELLTVQARFLTELHPSLFPLYVLGILMVFFGTIYGCFELHTRAVYECGRTVFRRFSATPLEKFRRFVVAYAVGSGLLLIWMDWDPVALLTPPSLLGGLLACGLWCFTMLWADRRFTPKPFQMGAGLEAALWISGILLSAFGVTAIYDYVIS